MGKYDNTANTNSTVSNAQGSSRNKAVAWANFTFRLKDGASSQLGIPFVETDYVQRTILKHMRNQPSDEARRELLKKLICKAIDNGDFDFRFVVERSEDAVGELDI